jgi:hypothetical protein
MIRPVGPGDELPRHPLGKVTAEILAVLDAVAEAPPPAFRGGGKWEAMHDEMSGFYEVRVQGAGQNHRLFCVLQRDADDLGGSSIVAIDGLSKPRRSGVAWAYTAPKPSRTNSGEARQDGCVAWCGVTIPTHARQESPSPRPTSGRSFEGVCPRAPSAARRSRTRARWRSRRWYRSANRRHPRPFGGAQRPGRCTRSHGHSAASQAATASASGTSSSA